MTYIEILKADADKDNEILRLRLAVDLLRADLAAANTALGFLYSGESNA